MAALLAVAGGEVLVSPDLQAQGGLPLILALAHEQGSTLWACSQADALAPSPHWGNGEHGAQFVRCSRSQVLPALPGDWPRLTANALRPKAEGMVELRLTQELNGPRKGFGEKAWRLLLEKAPALKTKLETDTPLLKLAYTDRYLRSPLAAILLYEWIQALVRFSGGLAKETALTITTSRVDRNDLSDPCWLHQDWRDCTDRRAAFEALFKPLGRFTFSEQANACLPHTRALQLEWADGAVWEIRLDQGLGYWRTAIREPFPFDQRETKQADAMNAASPRLEASNPQHPTYWYLLRQP